jgi:glutathione S-transferase
VRIYRIPFSTNVERVALALGHKGLETEWVDVDPRDRSPVEEISGQPLVPVLVDDRGVHADSTAIIAYLEERYPDPPLYPRAEPRRTEVALFVDWFNRVWKRPPNEIEAELRKPAPDERRIGELGAELAGSLDHIEALLTGREYLYGDFSVADCAAFPFLKYALLYDPADDEPFHRILVENLPLYGRYPRVAEWIARVDAHPRA